MIRIEKNSANTVVLTLTENQTITNPDYLFEFTNDTTGEVKLFTASDQASTVEKPRFNEFIITDSTVELPYSGQMDFSPIGWWTYVVYEMAQGSPNDLDPDNALSILETGKVDVWDGTASTDVTFTEDEDKDNVVFDEP